MMDDNRRFRSLVFAGFIVPLLILGFSYLAWSLRPLMLPLIIGILLAYLFRPLKTLFRYRWLPNSLRLAIIFSLILGVLFGGALFVKSNIPSEKEKLELLVRMKFKMNEKFDKIMGIDSVTGRGNYLYEMMADDIDPVRVQLSNILSLSPEQSLAFEQYHQGLKGHERVSEKYYEYFLANTKTKAGEASLTPEKSMTESAPNANLNAVGSPVSGLNSNSSSNTSANTNSGSHEQSVLKMVVSLLSIWLLLPIAFLFFLIDDGAIAQFFVRLVPNRYFELSLTVLEAVDGAIGKYLRGLSMECGLVGVSLALGLFVIGAAPKVAILIGLLAAFATAIPLVGPVMGLGLSLTYGIIAEEINPLIPMVTLDNLLLAVSIVVAIVFALDNLVFQPIVLGSAVNLHPLVVILGIMGGSMLFGLAGVLLAVPAIVITKTILQNTFRGLKDYRII
ncbi:MAG: AI-2E family transporter [Bdellovibrionales bacterium]|nr:AI-2E family transporter [Bdellovibrionales bacterium]